MSVRFLLVAALFGVFAVPSRGVAPDSLEQAVYGVLEDVQENGITTEELERAKTRARADLVSSLASNGNLAGAFERLDALDAVTAEDVQRVARETFRPANRTVAMIKSADDGPSASAR